MTANTPDPEKEYPTTGPSERPYERYGTVETADGEVIVYDRERHEGWLQSPDAVDLEAWR